MSHHQILIVYATSYGQTQKIALRMRDQLATLEFGVEVANVDDFPPEPKLQEFDGVIVLGSIIRGRHSRRLQRYVIRHRDDLPGGSSAFCSVSGSAGSKNAREREEAERMLQRFLNDTGWRPALHATFAGAMAFTKYSPIVRWVMKRISRKEGGPTDTSRDHELTDWAQVERFVEAFMTMVNGGTAASGL